ACDAMPWPTRSGPWLEVVVVVCGVFASGTTSSSYSRRDTFHDGVAPVSTELFPERKPDVEPTLSTQASDHVREIRRKTRRKYSTEEKIRIVLEGLRGEERRRRQR